MSLTQALNTASSGLKVTQAALGLVASNVANAQTPGYVRKTLQTETIASGGVGNSVRVGAIQREIDTYLQKQFRVESAGGAYADLRANFYDRLQQIYGDPSSASALSSVFDTFANSVQTLVTSPDSVAARSVVLSSAQVLAQTLNGMTNDLQALRADAENGIAAAVATANDAMAKISELNAQLAGRNTTSAGDAALADQRDALIDQLSQLMDIRVIEGSTGEVNIFTNSGLQLVGSGAATLAFDAHGTVNATTQWDADPAKRSLGTLTLVSQSGGTVDLIANNSLRSGSIAAYINMRDNVLVEAQRQLDGLASTMAQAMSDTTVTGTAATSGAQAGFDVDTSGWLNGNRINLTYTDVTTGTQHNVSIVRVDDPSALPLDDDATADPNDEVIGVDFSGGLASVVTQLNAAFGGALDFSNPAGSTLRVLDDGGPNTTDVDALSVTQTATALAGGDVSLPMFTDGSNPYTGAISANGSQSAGFAGRITVNSLLAADPSKLVLYDTTTQTGDPTRPNFIYDRLTNASFAFSPNTGMGSTATPYSGTLPDFLQQVLSEQGQAASNASSLAEGQAVVVNALQQRVNETSGVNVDQEMANLISLQTAYGANARVMSAVKDMLDMLMNVI
jgi:flagellar hook-associated protein 1 FlgK